MNQNNNENTGSQTNRRLRIAHLIISNAWGGAENVAYNIARHLAHDTYQFIVVNREIVDHFLPLGNEGVGVYSIGKMYDCGPMMRPSRYLRATGRIKKILVNEEIDIVHFHLVWGIIAYYPLFGKGNRATAITLHGEVRSAHLGIRTRIERSVLWRALGKHIDAVISCSSELTDYLKKENVHRPDITTVIHNGINETEWENVEPVDFGSPGKGETGGRDVDGEQETVEAREIKSAAAAAASAGTAPFRLLFVGNLRPEKGMDLLVEAIHRIYRGGEPERDIEAYIIGTGEMMQQMEEIIREYGLEERVNLLGFVEKERMYGYYRSCDALASLCDWEGCSIVQLEAMAAGLPIIATAVGGTPEIIENGRNGFLVKRDAEAIKAAILKAAASPGLLAKMRKNNLEDIQDYYWRNIVKKYLQIYEKIGYARGKK